ncbi:MAG: PrsW family intramembrane metalloprotease [Anaerolineales bacterium]
MGLLVSVIAGIVPMFLYAWLLYFLDRYEKEPLHLLVGVFLWGAVIAAGAAFMINTLSSMGLYLITQSEFATQLTLSTLVAPAVEETLKGLAVLVVFLIFRFEFDSLLDGVVYGAVTALGFAATENIWYIHQLGFLENNWQGLLDLTLIRVLMVGWQHPFYTAFIGLGFAVSRRSTQAAWKLIAPIFGWLLAVSFHFFHNLLASLLNNQPGLTLAAIWDWIGYIGLFVLIILLIRREQHWMKEYLTPEFDQELLSSVQYQIACSAWRQSIVFFQARMAGNYHPIRRFYQVCGDLMHKKRQLSRHGDESGTASEISRLRAELTQLAETI